MSVLRDIGKGTRVLLLNPPISDTSEAEELDMITCVEPFGLLRLGSLFREQGATVELVDCLRDPLLEGRLRRHSRKKMACGNGEEDGIEKNFFHFGLDDGLLARRLQRLAKPDVIAISPIFTWHLGPAVDAVAVCREVFPDARLVAGGNVATLCPEESAALGADELHQGDLEGAVFAPTAIDLVPGGGRTDFLRMVKGCPYKCTYCVTNLLNGGRVVARDPADVFREMRAKIEANGTRTFVFFDDFVLYRQSRFLDPFLELVAKEKPGVEIEFALGFSAHMITEAFARRMRAAGVERVILALETINERRGEAMHRPQHIDEFVRAARLLGDHGYRGRNLRAFYLIGLPDQTTDEILRAILFLYHLGVTPSLTTYTITPGSGDWDRFGDRVAGRGLDELAPGLWRFAHEGMRVRELDAIYRYFHERYFPVNKILRSATDDPVIVAMQRIIREKGHLPESW